MDAADIFELIMMWAMLIVAVLFLIYIIYRSFRTWAEQKKTGEHTALGPIYGAWQGHSLGTTTMEPGELSEIERRLREASKHDE
ncbi:MAG: hypothetical protein Q8922_03350 [Bacteroidota bacterium]|nr:hypothetical protein [Bacteroidota bacterium]MDP4233002.1 hypothetical protein [Bacteroidota bacterium]MDP4242046.1 hypothetical protein [Bacteroidota bacterium]MDP4286949.1 hypothetical protein [Bacteroidota bacterium]